MSNNVFFCVSAFLLSIGLLAISGGAATAQPTWIEGISGGPQAGLKWTTPSFNGDELGGDAGTTFPASRAILSGQYPIGEQVRVVADLPIARFGTDLNRFDTDLGEGTTRGDTRSTKIGNPYLGAHGTLEGRWSIGGGLRLPLASLPTQHFSGLEEVHQSSTGALALLTGAIGDIGRFEAFSPNTFAFRGYGEYTVRSPSGLSARVRPGLSLLSPTENTESRENLVLLDYKGEAWYEDDRFCIGAGVGGRINLNADRGESFEERTLLFFESAAQIQLRQFRPGVTFRLPMNDELSNILDYSVGVNLMVTL